ncbi:MAG: ATP-binding protein [Solidesulfovibrio sp.]
MFHSIKNQVLAGQFMLVTLLTLALGAGVFHVAAGILERKELEKVHLLADALARETALAIRHGQDRLSLLSSSRELTRFYTSHDFHLLQALFDRYRESFTALTYVNKDGVREYAASGTGYTDRDADLSADAVVAEALYNPGRIVSALRQPPQGETSVLVMALASRSPFGEDQGAILAAMPVAEIARGIDAMRMEQGGFAALVEGSGTLLSIGVKRPIPLQVAGETRLAKALALESRAVFQEDFAGNKSFIAIAPVGLHGLSTLVVQPRRLAINDEISQLRSLVAIIAGVAALVAALVAIWWTKGIARPLARLAEAARRVSSGDLSARAPMEGPGETRAVALAFNTMTTDLVASREELTRAKRSLENILANMNEALMVIDRQGRVAMCNRAGRAMLGLPAYAPLGFPAATLFAADDPLGGFLDSAPSQDLLAGGGMTGLEKTLLGKNGRPIPVLVSLALLRGPDSPATGVVCLAMDITERKRVEDLTRARKAAEAVSRAKTEFLAVLSHEMRTPLNIILGILDHLQGVSLPPQVQIGIYQALHAGQTLLDVIAAMLDYASLEAGRVLLHRRPFSPHALASDVASRFADAAKTKDIGLLVDVAPNLPEKLVGDPTRLAQVLGNLLSNAVRFTATGEARLTLCGLPPDENASPRHLLALISDTGMGVGDAKLDYIFEPFTQEDASTTRRFGGIGLGLAITRRLVNLMDGSICMESRVGQGTDVFVSLPLEIYQAKAEETAAPGTNAAPAFGQPG